MSPTETDANSVQVIAVPTAGGRLCMHFGHCEQFVLLNVNKQDKKILGSRSVTPPAHQPGVLPRWLHDQGVSLVIAGGMGGRAQNIFADHGIEVIVGAPSDPPESLVASYLEGTLQSGENICDH